MRSFLDNLQTKRRGRNRQMIEKMTRGGVEVTLEELDQRARGRITSRLHFAQWLIERGHARDVPDAFARWLGPGKPFYVPKVRPTLEEALTAIHDAGGKAVVAHPLSLWVSWGRLGSLLPEWREAGLDGIEAWHPGADKRQGVRFEALAQENNLLVTGGSDFHGPSRKDRILGIGGAGKPIPDEWLAPFVPEKTATS
jgi:predicted metal-dependent phosphoesterase TrpH